MKNKLIRAFLCCTFLAAALGLSSCSAENSTSMARTADDAMQETLDENVVKNNQVALYAAGDESVYSPDPFSSYTFEVSNLDEKYMITIELNPQRDAFILTLEDSNFNFTTYEITAPRNYTLNIPFSQDDASKVCTVIKNTIDSTPVPDILEFTFYLNNFEDESLAYTVKKFYSIKNSEIHEIYLIYDSPSVEDFNRIFDSGGFFNYTEYCSEFTLFHTEPFEFMPEPEITYDENYNAQVNVYTYTFDPDRMTMVKSPRSADFETDPLYYGYAVRAVADDIAQYFTTTSLNVTDYENYVEVPSVSNSEINDYFFKVDDSRFKTLEDLTQFTRKYFSEKLVNDMFFNAPQKYRDIDGELYTIVGDGGYDFTLGQITIASYDIEGNVITYHTKQEKFNDEGEFVSFIDGGDFVVEVNPNDGTFKITQYRLSY